MGASGQGTLDVGARAGRARWNLTESHESTCWRYAISKECPWTTLKLIRVTFAERQALET